MFQKKTMKKAIEAKDFDGKLKPTEDGRFTFKANMNCIFKAVKELKESFPDPAGVYDGPASFIYGKKSPFKV